MLYQLSYTSRKPLSNKLSGGVGRLDCHTPHIAPDCGTLVQFSAAVAGVKGVEPSSNGFGDRYARRYTTLLCCPFAIHMEEVFLVSQGSSSLGTELTLTDVREFGLRELVHCAAMSIVWLMSG